MPVRISIDFPDGDPRRNMARVPDDIAVNLRRGMTMAAMIVVRQAKQNLTDLQIVDRGLLRSSIDMRIEQRGNQIEAIVFASAAHGLWVEFGRRGIRSDPTKGNANAADAAFPPIDPIRDWVTRNRRAFGLKPGVSTDADSIAYLIARKIYWYGIKPRPFLVPAFLRVRGQFVQVLRREVSRGFRP